MEEVAQYYDIFNLFVLSESIGIFQLHNLTILPVSQGHLQPRLVFFFLINFALNLQKKSRKSLGLIFRFYGFTFILIFMRFQTHLSKKGKLQSKEMMRWSEIRSLGSGSKHAISSHNLKNLHVVKRAQDSTCGAYYCANISWINHQQIQLKLCQSLCLMHLNISLLPLPGSESFLNSLICERGNVNSDNLSKIEGSQGKQP